MRRIGVITGRMPVTEIGRGILECGYHVREQRCIGTAGLAYELHSLARTELACAINDVVDHICATHADNDASGPAHRVIIKAAISPVIRVGLTRRLKMAAKKKAKKTAKRGKTVKKTKAASAKPMKAKSGKTAKSAKKTAKKSARSARKAAPAPAPKVEAHIPRLPE